MPPRKRRQRGHIGQLPSGAYRVRVYAGTDALTGRPRQLCETVPTYAEATKALTRLQGQVDEDTHTKSDITVRQAVERWLEVVVLEDTTRERYDDLIRLYVLHADEGGVCEPRGDLPGAGDRPRFGTRVRFMRSRERDRVRAHAHASHLAGSPA
jgi:hypothetical protein